MYKDSMVSILSTHLLAMALGGILMSGLKGQDTMPKKQPSGWDDLDKSGFFDSELCILGEDGDAACFIPMTEPELVTEKTEWGPRDKAVVEVVRCGDAEVSNPEEWYAQTLSLGKRQARSYRAHAAGFEGTRILRMTRHGAAGDQGTKYVFETVDPAVTKENATLAAKLLADAQAEK